MQKKLFDLRQNYTQAGIDKMDVNADPMLQFSIWMEQAIEANMLEPNAMTLATINSDGFPQARIVLLKEYKSEGFIFFSNYTSQKAEEIKFNPKVALAFLWLELERQVRITGVISRIDERESDSYFKSRPRESQIGAWASPQSKVLETRQYLINQYNYFDQKYKDQSVPRPKSWGGYIVRPETIEFWQGRPGRMHDRIKYTKNQTNWAIERLAP